MDYIKQPVRLVSFFTQTEPVIYPNRTFIRGILKTWSQFAYW